MDGAEKAQMVKSMHKSVKEQIERRNTACEKSAKKGRKFVQFVPGDLVWIHLRKERFPTQRNSKLMPIADGPFRVIEKINDNAYKLELPKNYNVSATFNVRDLTPYLEDGMADAELENLGQIPLNKGEMMSFIMKRIPILVLLHTPGVK